jgi:hypothetical protein
MIVGLLPPFSQMIQSEKETLTNTTKVSGGSWAWAHGCGLTCTPPSSALMKLNHFRDFSGGC